MCLQSCPLPVPPLGRLLCSNLHIHLQAAVNSRQQERGGTGQAVWQAEEEAEETGVFTLKPLSDWWMDPIGGAVWDYAKKTQRTRGLCNTICTKIMWATNFHHPQRPLSCKTWGKIVSSCAPKRDNRILLIVKLSTPRSSSSSGSRVLLLSPDPRYPQASIIFFIFHFSSAARRSPGFVSVTR